MKMNKLFLFWLLGLGLIMSCGKPNDPESIIPDDTSGGYKIVKKFATAGSAQDVLKDGNLMYIAQGEGGLMIVDITNPENPATVSMTTENLQGYSGKLAKRDSILYVAAGTNGIFVINVSNPVEPYRMEVSSPFKPARDLLLFGDYMFTSISENGVKISEISYPAEPDPRGGMLSPGYAFGMASTTDSANLMVACGEMGLAVYDISTFEEGFGNYRQIGWCDTPGYAEAVALLDSKSLAFMACGTAGLQIIDYSDTTNIHIVGSFDGGGYVKSLMYKNQRVYLAAELSGLQVIDVSIVTSPALLGVIDTEFAVELEMDENYIYLADEVDGLIVISIPD